ncbi:uncharacterized protein LOC123561658 [Mercenaria mercenaria]|uniref:uncharacterized protein LOC123561658 n=1 Tax=Mercenaria mercenaria TaxID=6596 RepID=UPI00234E4E82|nr:uncharacterized protein LOC123561658 [Mercenaria mercenaria]
MILIMGMKLTLTMISALFCYQFTTALSLPLIEDNETQNSNDQDQQTHASQTSINTDTSLKSLIDSESEVYVDIGYSEMTEKMNNSKSKLENKSNETEDDPLAGICQTPECIQQLQEYMKWRQDNGYPVPSGRWGK